MTYRHMQQQKAQLRMALTPKMRHSLKLLGMSTKDIHEHIVSALEENPFLKKAVDKNEVERSRNRMPSLGYNSTAHEYNEGMDKEDEDQRSSLLSQLRMLDLSKKDLEIAEYLISEMDDNGYIAASLEDAAEELFVTADEVGACLKDIQGLEPPGIGARDVCECLQLQLRRMNKGESLEYTIVGGFLSDLARNDVAGISKALDVTEDEVRAAISNIKKLNPKPASTMLSKEPKWVTPDLLAEIMDEKIRLDLNREWMPCLNLYNPYENESDVMDDLETQKFIKENMESAKHLIDNLKRREETMCRVADYIMKFHQDELKSGTDEIKSLTIRDISGALGFHPSTISRTVSNKYVQINNKVVLLKSFLSDSIKKENGEAISKTTVKKKIEALIKNEKKNRPLTDRAIEEKLAEQGIIINRRTIAKYRKSLRVLPTHLRRKIET